MGGWGGEARAITILFWTRLYIHKTFSIEIAFLTVLIGCLYVKALLLLSWMVPNLNAPKPACLL